MWIPQKQLDEAVVALKKIKPTTHCQRKLEIKHPSQELTDKQWEAAVCAIFAVHSDYADSVLPENTQTLYLGTS